MSGVMTIGQLAAAAQVTPATIRYYEQLGLLPNTRRTAAGYREYSPTVVRRLAVIRNAQQFGFSLREIASFLRVRDEGGAPCRTVRDAAQQMLTNVEQQIADLTAQRDQMLHRLALWDERLRALPPDARAYLLETLDRSPAASTPEVRSKKLKVRSTKSR
jgi:MerR family transcriptional regulator, Zn(II)-responsive regulator of zntA